MRYRLFGTTKLKVSEIGYGGWGIGGNIGESKAYGPTNDKDSLLSLNLSFDKGVNFFDTSPLYGFGHSEKLIGEAFKTQRKNIIIATKVGYTNYKGDQNFSSNYIEESVNASLKRLKTDYIDILQLHDISYHYIENNPEIFTILENLKKKGKCNFFGFSTKTHEDTSKIIDKKKFHCVQLNFNLIDQRAHENNLFEQCTKNKIAIIGRTPLCFGFLTGQYNTETIFHADDHRSRWSKEQIDLWSQSYNLFINKIKNLESQTAAQIALRFCLSFKDISTVIPGMLNTNHVEENLQSSEFGPFSLNTIDEFKKIYNENSFFINTK